MTLACLVAHDMTDTVLSMALATAHSTKSPVYMCTGKIRLFSYPVSHSIE